MDPPSLFMEKEIQTYVGSRPNRPQTCFYKEGVDSITDGISVPWAQESYHGFLKHKTYKK